MSIIRITKRFHFEMAHALYGYDGICRNIHGHSYLLDVTVRGTVCHHPGHPKDGMVMDFHDLKEIVKHNIVNQLDHSIMVNSLWGDTYKSTLSELTSRLIVVDFQPTTENILSYIARKLAAKLPPELLLFSLKLHETTSSYAEWFAAENP